MGAKKSIDIDSLDLEADDLNPWLYFGETNSKSCELFAVSLYYPRSIGQKSRWVLVGLGHNSLKDFGVKLFSSWNSKNEMSKSLLSIVLTVRGI